MLFTNSVDPDQMPFELSNTGILQYDSKTTLIAIISSAKCVINIYSSYLA